MLSEMKRANLKPKNKLQIRNKLLSKMKQCLFSKMTSTRSQPLQKKKKKRTQKKSRISLYSRSQKWQACNGRTYSYINMFTLAKLKAGSARDQNVTTSTPTKPTSPELSPTPHLTPSLTSPSPAPLPSQYTPR